MGVGRTYRKGPLTDKKERSAEDINAVGRGL